MMKYMYMMYTVSMAYFLSQQVELGAWGACQKPTDGSWFLQGSTCPFSTDRNTGGRRVWSELVQRLTPVK